MGDDYGGRERYNKEGDIWTGGMKAATDDSSNLSHETESSIGNTEAPSHLPYCSRAGDLYVVGVVVGRHLFCNTRINYYITEPLYTFIHST